MSSSQPPLRRSTMHALAHAPAQPTAASHPHAGTSRKAPEKEQPPVPDDIRELRLLVKKINKEVFSEHWSAFLAQLQLALDKHQPGLVNVWPHTIMWVDKDEYNRVSHWYPNIEFQHSATLQRWVDKDAAHDHQYSLAVMMTPPSFLVGQETREDWLKHKFHIWALLTAHAPKGMTGKSIITYDTDVKEFHNDRAGDGIPLCENLPVPGGKPGKGHCFRFTMDWLVDLVENGLNGRHKNGGLAFLEGFCEIQL
ncbi:hypothetical protein B0H14DRAFT_3487187 [Mycena olivaceomarginata]|nr:hypothetical protein B0H14DRAFT_3487187 [Mycena olivaceomarginata]